MQGVFLREYGVQTTIDFQLYEVDGVDFQTGAVHAVGDTIIMRDEGAEGNTTNAFTDEGNGYSIVLTAAEMQAARIVVYVIDQTATKVWLDTALVIDTYGNASAQHAFDLNTAMSDETIADQVWDEQAADHQAVGSFGEAQSLETIADNVWDEVMESGAPVNARTARNLMRIFASVLAGKTANAGDWSALSLDETKTRIAGTLDASGNRIDITTLDGS